MPLPGLLIDTDTDTASDDAVAPVPAAAAAAPGFTSRADPEATAVVLAADTPASVLVDRRHFAAPNVTLVRPVNADGFSALLFEPCATTPGTAERLRPVMGAA